MKPFRLFLFTGVLLFVSSCAVSENPDKGFDKEYQDRWEPITSPTENVSALETTPKAPSFSKTFQIQGMDKGYQCTTTCTIPE